MSQGAEGMLSTVFESTDNTTPRGPGSSQCTHTHTHKCGGPWLHSMFVVCRSGLLPGGLFNFLHGSPAQHCGSRVCSPSTHHGDTRRRNGSAGCGNTMCATLHLACYASTQASNAWPTVLATECASCTAERQRQCRLVQPSNGRPQQEPFRSTHATPPKQHTHYQSVLWHATSHTPHNTSVMQHIWLVFAPLHEKTTTS